MRTIADLKARNETEEGRKRKGEFKATSFTFPLASRIPFDHVFLIIAIIFLEAATISAGQPHCIAHGSVSKRLDMSS